MDNVEGNKGEQKGDNMEYASLFYFMSYKISIVTCFSLIYVVVSNNDKKLDVFFYDSFVNLTCIPSVLYITYSGPNILLHKTSKFKYVVFKTKIVICNLSCFPCIRYF